jgi:hypothetical protein
MALGGVFVDGGARPMIATIVICAALACTIAFAVLRKPQRDAVSEPA